MMVDISFQEQVYTPSFFFFKFIFWPGQSNKVFPVKFTVTEDSQVTEQYCNGLIQDWKLKTLSMDHCIADMFLTQE